MELVKGVRILWAIVALYAWNFWLWSKRRAMRVPVIAAVRNRFRRTPAEPGGH
jgi:hypothetical protein